MEKYILLDVKTTILLYMQVQQYNHYLKDGISIKKILNNEKSIKYNYPVYKKIRETNIEDWYIELYEEFSCENKEQLNKREGQIIREIGTLNKRIEGRTPKEYRDSNKELISEKKKIYNKNNKEIISEKKKEQRKK